MYTLWIFYCIETVLIAGQDTIIPPPPTTKHPATLPLDRNEAVGPDLSLPDMDMTTDAQTTDGETERL